jgi:hypothetical protein
VDVVVVLVVVTGGWCWLVVTVAFASTVVSETCSNVRVSERKDWVSAWQHEEARVAVKTTTLHANTPCLS